MTGAYLVSVLLGCVALCEWLARVTFLRHVCQEIEVIGSETRQALVRPCSRVV